MARVTPCEVLVLPPAPLPRARGQAPLPRLRAAVAAVFVLDGAVFGSWAARVPDVAAAVGAGHSALGVALLCLSVGALAAMQVTGALCARLGAGVVTTVAALLLCVSLVLPGLAGSMPALCAALLAFGAATGTVNVAANAVGVTVERRLGRPLLSGLHAGFSLGGLAGALLGGLLATVAGVAAHLVAVGAGGLLVTAWAGRALVGADGPRSAAPEPAAARAGRARPTAVLVVLGAVAGCTAFGEGALSDWGALHLREELGASTALAAAGYAGFSLAMACGRLAGARLVAAVGERRLLAGGAVLAAAGGAAAVTATSVPAALAGYVLVGLGLANVFPLAVSRAGVLAGARGIALATTVGYTGLLGGPPLIGLLAEHAGLPAALATVPLLALVAAGLVLTISGDALRVPVTPRGLLAAVALRVQPLVSGFGHGTAVYVRDLRVLQPL
ncbi:Predicted arabinose efflux permease, MFS family [Geodermatophilus pulveris]|uniref:Predicted arabinose efflux permease, MFS family n=1 Tax=Geodermatophilus pulveris TaxID=1564159 RepID=A0A239JNS2_9ACTN|nr:MFS transporter [Geodermatophilus pulveris]SNT06424.1 Predicted arabinose efflux permease, MFS family [Geodermatophilus pulveris]